MPRGWQLTFDVATELAREGASEGASEGVVDEAGDGGCGAAPTTATGTTTADGARDGAADEGAAEKATDAECDGGGCSARCTGDQAAAQTSTSMATGSLACEPRRDAKPLQTELTSMSTCTGMGRAGACTGTATAAASATGGPSTRPPAAGWTVLTYSVTLYVHEVPSGCCQVGSAVEPTASAVRTQPAGYPAICRDMFADEATGLAPKAGQLERA